jgi:ribosomal protein S18 acetylase RimI-like enzyme
MKVRPYESSDAEAVERCIGELADFERRIDRRVLPAEGVAGWYREHLLSDCASFAGTFFVAELRGSVVGFAVVLGEVANDDIDEEPYDFAYISDLAVLDSHRRGGVGRALMDRCEAFAREAGARWLRISVLAANEGARRLYEDRGFRDRLILLEKPLSAE